MSLDEDEQHRLRGWFLDEWATTETHVEAFIAASLGGFHPGQEIFRHVLLDAVHLDAKLTAVERLVGLVSDADSAYVLSRLRRARELRNRTAHSLLDLPFGDERHHQLLDWKRGHSRRRPFDPDEIAECVAGVKEARTRLLEVLGAVQEETYAWAVRFGRDGKA